ncbi:MAG: hypothetical protein O2800_02735 [Planctomycetota bacterium]|nr:hypothetical protein [Planctomycetota bacterium]
MLAVVSTLAAGFSQSEMDAIMAAASPGPMDAFLAKGCGHWTPRIRQRG